MIRGGVDGRADRDLTQDGLVEIEDPLAESARRHRPAVVCNVWRQQSHAGARRGVTMACQLIADQPVVDEQERPGVMGVSGVCVVPPFSMKHLGDAGDPRSPRAHPIAGNHLWSLTGRSVWSARNATTEPGPRFSRPTAAGLSKIAILRCLKRYLARDAAPGN